MHSVWYKHWHSLIPTFALGTLLGFANVANACELPTTLSHTVTAIADTRSLKLDDGSELRLAAVLGPTSYDSPAAPKSWPAEQAALTTLRHLSLNRNVTVSLERVARDRYSRLIGHALLASHSNNEENGVGNRWLQARIVRAGQARVALTPEIDAACAKLLLTLEAAANATRACLI